MGTNFFTGGGGGTEYNDGPVAPFAVSLSVSAHEGGGSDITPPTVALSSLTVTVPSGSNCTVAKAANCIAGVCLLDLSMAGPGVCAVNLASSPDGDDVEECWSLVLTPASAGNFQAESDRALKVCGY